jgi:transposase-like protein
MGAASELSAEQRQEIVLAMLRREEPVEILARRHGISTNILYAWRDVLLVGGKRALTSGKGKSDPKARRIQELSNELNERDRVIGEMTIANRILKSAGRIALTAGTREEIQVGLEANPGKRLTEVLKHLGTGVTGWYRKPMERGKGRSRGRRRGESRRSWKRGWSRWRRQISGMATSG